MLNAGTKEAMDAMIEFLTNLTSKIKTQKMGIDSPIEVKWVRQFADSRQAFSLIEQNCRCTIELIDPERSRAQRATASDRDREFPSRASPSFLPPEPAQSFDSNLNKLLFKWNKSNILISVSIYYIINIYFISCVCFIAFIHFASSFVND